jgi:hypothetical protein
VVVDLGEVEIMENISVSKILKAALLDSGLELMDDKNLAIEKNKK